MAASAANLASHLEVIDAERQRRAALPGLLDRVTALKKFQQRRFSHTYADLLPSTRYGAASRYFLDELYGPNDFTARDAQFARVAPAISRVFPSEVAKTVAILAELHALSETLDTGVELVRRYSNPGQHRHSIQLEINRKLYMDEQTLALNDGFATLQASLRSLVALLLQTDPRAL